MAPLEGWDLERYRDLLRRRGLKIQRDVNLRIRFDHSDLADETILHALRAGNAPAAAAPETVKRAWLQTIQDNILKDWYKQTYGPKRDARREERFGRSLTESPLNEAERFPDSGPAPDEPVVAADLDARVTEEIDRLPPDEAEVVRRKRAGQTFEQIAAALDIPPATAASRYYAGIKRLRQRLKGEDPS